jgi:hypothetical protein
MMMVPASYDRAFATGGRLRPGRMPAPRSPPILLWMHNGLGYIYDNAGFNRLMLARRTIAAKGREMSIEQFIDNEV